MVVEKKKKVFKNLFIIWIAILAIGLVKKGFQNDTFYTIKIGELITNSGIDMMDHFSFHTGLAYTYPHWLYDVFIYVIYHFFGFTGIYISSIILFIILLWIVFKVNQKICHNLGIAAFTTFICALSLSGFVTARAQLVSFILFTLEIEFIESFLKNKKKIYVYGLLLISLVLCNVHVAVWPFYFIIYLPYLAEALIVWLGTKWKFLGNLLGKKFVTDEDKFVKYLLIIMAFSLVTGLITPIGDTPYTYLIKTMMGNSQEYISEHQMMSWKDSPFTIIIVFETLFLAIFTKPRLRDIFMVLGLTLMSIVSIRHMSLLALIGTIYYARVFSDFVKKPNILKEETIINFFNKKMAIGISFVAVLIFSGFLFYRQSKNDFVDKSFYPVNATKYILDNVDLDKAKIFNDYNFGSYLLFNNIPVFIDSRADLYTKQFSGFDYDIFDDYEYIISNYRERFEFYQITHVLIYKNDNQLFDVLSKDNNYKILYEDDDFAFFEKLANIDNLQYSVSVSYNS